MAYFISFEGGDGAGKTTQAQRLVNRLNARGVETLFVHEPGGTNLGEIVRDIVKRGLPSEPTLTDAAELLLFAAARAELVGKVLAPILASNSRTVIVADRYVDSTTAYQGGGRGIDMALVDAVNALATGGVMPHLTFLLDIPPTEALTRLGGIQLGFQLDEPSESLPPERHMRHMEGTKFEEQPIEFHKRIHDAYKRMAAAEPERWRTISASAPEDDIADAVWAGLVQKFPGLVDAPMSSEAITSP